MLIKFPKECWIDIQQAKDIAKYMKGFDISYKKNPTGIATPNGIASILQWAIWLYSNENHPELDYDFFLIDRKKATTGDFETKNISLPKSRNRNDRDI